MIPVTKYVTSSKTVSDMETLNSNLALQGRYTVVGRTKPQACPPVGLNADIGGLSGWTRAA